MARTGGTRTRTVRLSGDQADMLDVLAAVDGASANEEMRRAIASHIDARRGDPEFQKRLRASIERNRAITGLLLR
ncbi:MAG: hypothetical protein ABI725_03070 [Chloroflexota bacterium]